MEMRANASTGYPGRSYRYYTSGDALFEFGDGLSYTTFDTSCSSSETGVNVTAAKITCTVTNTGSRAGDEVVLLFHRPPAASKGEPQRPIRRLLDFARVSLAANAKADVVFNVVAAASLSLPVEGDGGGNAGARIIYTGKHLLELQGGREQVSWTQ